MSALDLVSRLLFPTPSSSYGLESFPSELVWVPKNPDADAVTCKPEDFVPCLFLCSPFARYTIFYCHSNAEDLGRCYASLCHLRYQFQVHVFAFEFPGYGLCVGKQATEESVTENAQAAFRFLRDVIEWPLDNIIIMGRSIGTGPALFLASQHEVHGVILVAPFLSVRELARERFGRLAEMLVDRFPNKDRLPLRGSAVLIVHGRKDRLIPCSHGERLYQLCRCRKGLVCPADMGHNTHLHTNLAFFVLPMLKFFSLPDYCYEDLIIPRWAFRIPSCYAEVSQQYYQNVTPEFVNVEQRLLGEGIIPPRGFDIDLACEVVAAAREDSTVKPSGGHLDFELLQECENSTTSSTREGIEDELPEPACEGNFTKVPLSKSMSYLPGEWLTDGISQVEL